MKSCFACVVSLALIALAAGCSQEPAESSSQPNTAAAIDGVKFLLADEPEQASAVIQTREKSSDGDEVVVVGRIGGSENPWIDGRAAFSIVDESLQACSDIPGDECPQPWDYCCATDGLATGTALVKVVDEAGNVVKADAKQLLGVKELSTVIVKGKAKRDDAGNLTVLASGVFVKKK